MVDSESDNDRSDTSIESEEECMESKKRKRINTRKKRKKINNKN